MKEIAAIPLARSLIIVFLILFTGNTEAKCEENPDERLGLDQLIQEAIEKNPGLAAARDKWESAKEIIQAQRALPDTQVSYTYFVESVETRVGPQKHIIGAKQKFPFYGKRGLKAEIAEKEAEALRASYEAAEDEVIRQTKQGFYELFYIDKITEVTKNEKSILKRFERTARTKYQTGEGRQQNLLKAHVEITKLDEKLLALEARRKTAVSKLNSLLDRPPAYPLGKPDQPDLVSFPLTKEDLVEMARENGPDLQARMSLIEKSDRAHSLAKKDYYPDFAIGANYIQIDEGPLPVDDNGKDAFNVTVSINLPIWRGKLSSQVSSASKMIRAQRSQYHNMLNRILSEVEDTYFKIQTTTETLELYKKVLVPQAEQSLKSAEAGYLTGVTSFLDLLDAQRVLLRIQYSYWRAYTDYLKHIAHMERTVGTQFTENLASHSASNAEEG